MMMAGTPCPYDGLIGPEAKAAWKANEGKIKDEETDEGMSNETKKTLGGVGVGSLLLLLLL